MEAPHLNVAADHDDELARVVARIRSRGTQLPLATPSAEAVASVLAHLRDEEPLTAAEIAEHERLWHLIEDEARARERANDHAWLS